ncbi:MAG: hypothetical protein JRJ29_11640 [Deltaproteobacteria bacterium]|nr:hypothetical protein [Deltaproteobacteria bacterium]
METFDMIKERIAKDPPPEQPGYPTWEEALEADIEQVMAWLLFLPPTQVDDPEYFRKMAVMHLISALGWRYRAEEVDIGIPQRKVLTAR